MRRHLPRLLGFLILAASVGYLAVVAARHASSFPAVVWSPRAAASLAGAMGLYLIMVLTGALAWLLLLRSLGAAGERWVALKRRVDPEGLCNPDPAASVTP